MISKHFGIVAKVTDDDYFVVVSPNSTTNTFEQPIFSDIRKSMLEACDIWLGDCCDFLVDGGTPFQFTRNTTRLQYYELKASRGEVIINNVPGYVDTIKPLAFRTEQFGNVVFRGFPEEAEQQDLYRKNAKANLKLKLSTDSNTSWVCDLSNRGFMVQHEVIGIVFPGNYVWTKDVFTGNDGRLVLGRSEKVGTWISMRFSREHYELYFPNVKSEDTDRFVTDNYTVISPRFDTSIDGINVLIKIPSVRIDVNKNYIKHSEFGIIWNHRRNVFEGATECSITITRMTPRDIDPPNKLMCVWKVLQTEKIIDPKMKYVRPRSKSANFRYRERTPSRHGSRNSLNFIPSENLRNNEMEPIMKRAVIMAMEPNRKRPGGSTCFLWLIDDHITSIYHTRSEFPEIEIGFIFEGKFKRANFPFQFECCSHNKYLNDQLVGVSTTTIGGSQLEMQVTIKKRTIEENRKITTTHEFFGTIEDSSYLLPDDCSDGIRIGVTSRKQKKKVIWFVNRIIPKKMEFINEFEKAWKYPIIQKLVDLFNYEFGTELKEFYEARKKRSTNR